MDINEEGDIEYFMGVNIDKVDSDTYHLSQPQLINQIVSDLGLLNPDETLRTTPSLTKNILCIFHDA